MSNKIMLHKKTLEIQYQNGLTMKQMADLHGVTEKTISRNIKEYHIKKPNKIFTKISKNKLKQLYCDYNWSINKIANRYHVKWETVKAALLELKIYKYRAKEKVNFDEQSSRN